MSRDITDSAHFLPRTGSRGPFQFDRPRSRPTHGIVGGPIIVVMPSPKSAATLHAKLLSNIREIQARGALTIVIAEEGDDTVRPYADHLIEIPAVSTLFQPLLSTIRCRCSPPGWRRPAATTWTSRAIWPSPSPSSSVRTHAKQ